MVLIDWTGEYHVHREHINGLLYYRFLEDMETRLDSNRPELYALFARVKYYPGKFDVVTSVMMSAGLTLDQAETEIKITSPERAERFAKEVIDYRKVNFWGQDHLNMKPEDTVYDAVEQLPEAKAFGVVFR